MKAIKGKKIGEVKHPKMYALQAKDGHLATSITGMVLVCTHKLKAKGYRCVEVIVK